MFCMAQKISIFHAKQGVDMHAVLYSGSLLTPSYPPTSSTVSLSHNIMLITHVNIPGECLSQYSVCILLHRKCHNISLAKLLP